MASCPPSKVNKKVTMEEEEVEKEVAERQDHQERSERHLDSSGEDLKGSFGKICCS